MVRGVLFSDQDEKNCLALTSSTSKSSQNETTTNTFICIIHDLTDASNTCKRHVINLSSTYRVENLIREASNFFSYEADSFNLMWKCSNGELMNLSELQTVSSMSLFELGLSSTTKNTFEIHEREGPPVRVSKANEQIMNVDSDGKPAASSLSSPNLHKPSRRNAFSMNDENEIGVENEEYGPMNRPINTSLHLSSNSFLTSDYDDHNPGFVGLINQAMTCYLNSLLQTLYMTPEFRNAIYRWNCDFTSNTDEDSKKSIPFQLQRLFLNLQTSNKKSIQTHDLTKSFGWNSDDAFQQHDVQELCRVMFDALEKTFKGTLQENLINELYQGKIIDYVKCLECNTESRRTNVFLDISLCIKPFGSDKTYESVQEALDAYVQPEILDENNKYFCDKCNQRCKAHKGLKFESFPYIISLQLNRFDFDYKTMSRFKLSDLVSFDERLNIKKYLINDDDNEQADANKKTTEPTVYDYELFSIMIHSGSASGGHYYAYIKCFETNQWYNFNDERVSKLDKADIRRTFGTSYSTYSSTTAYMLLYRQVNTTRNEKFMKADEFNANLKSLLERERHMQAEADRLKEIIENSCKIKVIMPVSDETHEPHENYDTMLNASCSKKLEKSINIHKDLTLEQAKLEILKEFNIKLDTNKHKCRILKYDTFNDTIEHSYANENELSVFEALGFTKFPYGFCWLLEIAPVEHLFVTLNSNDLNIKIIHVNISSFETQEMFSLRLLVDSTVQQLREHIASKLGIENVDSIRMALERANSIYNNTYANLNKSPASTLKSLGFVRVNRVLVEYEDEEDLHRAFETSRFYFAIDSILNLLQTTVYLPTEEQCELFVRKSQRHSAYVERKMCLSRSTSANTPELVEDSAEDHQLAPNGSLAANQRAIANSDDNTLDSYDQIASVQSCNTLSSLADNQLSPIRTNVQPFVLNEDIQNTRTQLTQAQRNDLKLIEDHFNSNQTVSNQYMETSFDEGIGSSSVSTINTKLSPSHSKSSRIGSNAHLNQNQDLVQTVSNCKIDIHKVCTQPSECAGHQNSMLNVAHSLTANYLAENEPGEYDFEAMHVESNDIDNEDLDVNVDDNDMNNLDDDEFDEFANDERDDDDFGLPKDDFNYESESCANNRALANPESVSMVDDTSIGEFKQAHKRSELNLNDAASESSQTKTSKLDNNEQQQQQQQRQRQVQDDYDQLDYPTKESSNIEEENSDDLPTYSSVQNRTLKKLEEIRFIKSNLIVNNELGTRMLEIRLDKRIDLNDFKTHINEYLKIGNENFRVFRLTPNDLECELTAYENQFFYLQQSTKFLVKLGPPLKYGEYVLQVYKLNVKKGLFSYLCDFMVVHGLSVLNHKELLKEDLKDECNLDVEIENIRLRKKTGKRPGAILLDNEVFGVDLFVNSMSELCIEILEEAEKKTSKTQTSIYLRHWKPDEYELGDLQELIVEGSSFDALLSHVSTISNIPVEKLEVLKCKRDFPYKSPILDLHKDMAWKDNYFLAMDKLEDGNCFYYRDKTLKLGEISEEKRREINKEENQTYRPSSSYSSRKETGIRIHVDK